MSESFDIMSLKADENLAEDGVWLEFYGNSRLKIAQNQNTKHQAYINNQYKIHRRKLDMEDKNADKLAEKISTEGAARHLLKDWEGITVNGAPQDYSVDLAIQLMVQIPTLKKEVEDQSRRLQNFQTQADEADIEDVKPISPGNLNGESQSD